MRRLLIASLLAAAFAAQADTTALGLISFPAFFTRDSGQTVDHRLDSPEEIAKDAARDLKDSRFYNKPSATRAQGSRLRSSVGRNRPRPHACRHPARAGPSMKQIEATILGQSYMLACPPDGEALLREAVAIVDREMSAIRDAGKVKARERMAVLAALNLAHRVVGLEREANQHTQDLEQTLSKLLNDVPDELSAPVPLLDEDGA